MKLLDMFSSLMKENLIACISLVVAIYAALIGTINALRERKRDTRTIQITLRHIDFEERFELILENIGFRPISIAEISMEVFIVQGKKKFYDRVPKGALFDDINLFDKPLILKEGEIRILRIQEIAASYLIAHTEKTRITVFDNSGNKFTKFKVDHRNAKWGGINI